MCVRVYSRVRACDFACAHVLLCVYASGHTQMDGLVACLLCVCLLCACVRALHTSAHGHVRGHVCVCTPACFASASSHAGGGPMVSVIRASRSNSLAPTQQGVLRRNSS